MLLTAVHKGAEALISRLNQRRIQPKRRGERTLEPSTAVRKASLAFFPRQVYFGWWIVFSTFTLGAMGGGFYFYGFTAFFLPMAEEFNVSRGTLSLVFGLAGLEGALLGPFQGWMVDRYGPRRIMLLGITMMSAGFLLMSYAHSVPMLFVYVILFIAVGASMGLFSPAFACVANWFIKKRGTALGIGMSGLGLGAVLVVLTNFLIEELDWRGAARVIAVIILVVGYPLASLMRHRPEQYGMLPDGVKEGQRPTDSSGPLQEEIDFTGQQALRTRAFWLIHISFAMRVFVLAAIGVHFLPAMDGKGYSAATSAALLGFFGVLSVPGRLGFGILADYLGQTTRSRHHGGAHGPLHADLHLGDQPVADLHLSCPLCPLLGRRSGDLRPAGRVLRQEVLGHHCRARDHDYGAGVTHGSGLRRVHLRRDQ